MRLQCLKLSPELLVVVALVQAAEDCDTLVVRMGGAEIDDVHLVKKITIVIIYI